ncbi:hypothetical protein MGN70_001087 [Eutypa lata]|nr:hypothetical protein MGN70_001087 [Eutypa lata]
MAAREQEQEQGQAAKNGDGDGAFAPGTEPFFAYHPNLPFAGPDAAMDQEILQVLLRVQMHNDAIQAYKTAAQANYRSQIILAIACVLAGAVIMKLLS